jgi:hypothetical protein
VQVMWEWEWEKKLEGLYRLGHARHDMIHVTFLSGELSYCRLVKLRGRAAYVFQGNNIKIIENEPIFAALSPLTSS